MSQIKKKPTGAVITDTKLQADTILLDNILDKKLVKFDNKQQMSMFFVAYKSINALYKELSDTVNYTIPDELVKRVVLETIPSIIKEYNSNLRKRCRINNTDGVNGPNGIDDTICLGRKIDGKQCTRKKYNNSDFCKNHIKKLSNGRVDVPITEPDVEPTDEPIEESNLEPELNNNEQISVSLEKEKDLELAVRHDIPKVEQKTTKKETVDKTDVAPLKVSKRGRKSKIQFDPRQYDNEYITLWEDIVEGEKVLVDNGGNVYTFNLENPVYIGKKDVTKKLNVRKIMDSLAK